MADFAFLPPKSPMALPLPRKEKSKKIKLKKVKSSIAYAKNRMLKG
jgi:hypothetical protein